MLKRSPVLLVAWVQILTRVLPYRGITQGFEMDKERIGIVVLGMCLAISMSMVFFAGQ